MTNRNKASQPAADRATHERSQQAVSALRVGIVDAGPGTPLPWKADYRDICQLRNGGSNLLVIGAMTGGFRDDAVAERDAAYIVRACNSFPDLVSALEWYSEQARLARLIHSEGDPGRRALSNDGGARARGVLAKARGQ